MKLSEAADYYINTNFMYKPHYLWAIMRIFMGLILFWAFIDKVFGLGFATKPESAWLSGASPTTGFLKFGTKGPFAGIFQSMAGSPVVDWLFMIGLACIGLALILGIGIKLAGYSGVVLMSLMWLAVLPPEHHPFLDEHIMYLLLFIGFAITRAGHTWGLGKKWSQTKIVQNHSWLE